MAWRPLVVVAVFLVSVGATSVVGAGEGSPTRERFVVSTEGLSDQELVQGLERADGRLVRTDATLDFAVVELAHPARFEAATGAAPVLDPPARLEADAVVAQAPNDTYYSLQWAPTELNMPQAWQLEPGSTSVVVAVVDTGIDLDHSDLDDVAVVLGTDYAGDDAVPEDQVGHGTHVAGIVAAERDNRAGVAGMARVTLYITKVIGPNGGTCSDVASAVRESADAGAAVINLSLSCPFFDPLADAVRYAHGAGSLVVAAAGNHWDNDRTRCVSFPASLAEAVAVAATDLALRPTDFSCRGPEVELAAPGELVLSTVPNGYGWKSGTSMATPHVAALAGLLEAQDPSRSNTDLRALLAQTARDLGEAGHDSAYGHGLIDPVAALNGGSSVYVPS